MRKKTRELIVSSFRILLVLLVVAIFTIGIFTILLTSFKSNHDISSSPPKWFFIPVLDHYINVFTSSGTNNNYVHFMYNSTVIAIIATSLSVLITLPAAYSIVRYFNGLGSFTLGFSLLLRMMPAMCMAIPVFIIFSRLKLVDTLTAIIMMHTLFIAPTALLLFIGYIQNFPREIEEAAQIDGANVIQTIGYVLFPIIRPGVAAVAILGFITSWNEFLFSMVLSFRNAITVTVATDYFVTNYAIRWGEMAAGIAVSTIPTLIFMFLAQRQIIEGMTAGAVKG